jgi:hypothetical protein
LSIPDWRCCSLCSAWSGISPGFVVVASLIFVGETSLTPLRMTLTRTLCEPGERLRVSAQVCSLSNIGLVLHLPPPQQGEYQGVFALGRGLGLSLPAALFLLAGLASVPLARSAERSAQARVPAG